MIEPDLTAEEVAALLKVNVVTVQRLLTSGRLQGYKVGRRWRVTHVVLDEFRNQGGANSVGRPRKPEEVKQKRPVGRPRKNEEDTNGNEI